MSHPDDERFMRAALAIATELRGANVTGVNLEHARFLTWVGTPLRGSLAS